MRSLPIWLALSLLVSCALIASSEVDIDYSHNIKGTGTIMTDYQMGAKQNTEASGRVRGTGDVMNKYLFSMGNSSENVTIEDEFMLTKSKSADPEMPVVTIYPQRPDTSSFMLVGTAWAGKIRLSVPDSINYSGELWNAPLSASEINASANLQNTQRVN